MKIYQVVLASVVGTLAVTLAALRLGLLDFATPNEAWSIPAYALDLPGAGDLPADKGRSHRAYVRQPLLGDALALPNERDLRGERRLVRTALPFFRNEAQEHHREFVQEWLGVRVLQYPNDLLTYQHLIWKLRPDVIVEAGTFEGGLTLYLAMLQEVANPQGRVVSVDYAREGWDALPDLDHVRKLRERITFIQGDSRAPETLERIAGLIPPDSTVLVLLDTLHVKPHVLRELKLYSPFVSKGSYLVVSDTHLDGTHWIERRDGPMAAVRAFLDGNDEFEIDSSIDRYFISANLSGYLRRVK